MKWCRIDADSFVLEVTELDPAIYFPTMTWLECPDEVSYGWFRNSDGTYRLVTADDRFTLEEAWEIKSDESERYARQLIREAYSNPTTGITTDPDKYAGRVESRRNDRADKIAGEIPLTQEEKEIAKTDQKLSEHEIKCWDASDKVIKNIEKTATPVEAMAIDVPTNTTWPVWVPPV